MEPAQVNRAAPILAAVMPHGPRSVPDLAGRIAQLRKARRLSQAELAKAAGVSQGTISAYEHGAKEPGASVVARLAKALGVSADELLGVKPGKPVSEMDPETRKLWKRLKKLRTLSYRDQRAVVRVLELMVRSKTAKADSTGPPG